MSHYIGDDCHTGHEQDAELSRLRAEHDEALAQVAVLFKELRRLHPYHHDPAPDPPPCGTCDIFAALPAEARVLLDRLQQVQTERAKLAAKANILEQKLSVAEAVVEAIEKWIPTETFDDQRTTYARLLKALAAWEEET